METLNFGSNIQNIVNEEEVKQIMNQHRLADKEDLVNYITGYIIDKYLIDYDNIYYVDVNIIYASQQIRNRVNEIVTQQRFLQREPIIRYPHENYDSDSSDSSDSDQSIQPVRRGSRRLAKTRKFKTRRNSPRYLSW